MVIAHRRRQDNQLEIAVDLIFACPSHRARGEERRVIEFELIRGLDSGLSKACGLEFTPVTRPTTRPASLRPDEKAAQLRAVTNVSGLSADVMGSLADVTGSTSQI